MKGVFVHFAGLVYWPTTHGWFVLVGHSFRQSQGPGALDPGTYSVEVLHDA